ncbi:MAG: hypothetical protein IJ734_07005 [Fibrobacter sp.]|nr:hypothetical protein [Fibrobacter sp.]
MRDYATMRGVLATAANAKSELCYNDFRPADQDDKLQEELARLADDGLLDADVLFGGGFGERTRCRVSGLTDEGREFYKLIENDIVWRIVHGTLKKANVDVSYPLLKEVCEEIVKRHVTSFIPDIK